MSTFEPSPLRSKTNRTQHVDSPERSLLLSGSKDGVARVNIETGHTIDEVRVNQDREWYKLRVKEQRIALDELEEDRQRLREQIRQMERDHTEELRMARDWEMGALQTKDEEMQKLLSEIKAMYA